MALVRMKTIYLLLSFLTVTLLIPGNSDALSLDGKALTDNHGRRIGLHKPFTKIISLYGAHTENIFFLGAGTSLIGVSRNETYPESAKSKPVFSYHDDPEKFLAFAPDLVLIRPMIDRGYPQLVRRLEKSGITVLSLQPSTVADMFTYWTALGLICGKPEAAENMVKRFQEKTEQYRELTSAVDEKKQVYFESIHKKMKTFTPDSMAIFVLETAGGINVASDADQVRNTNIAYYGKERILSKAASIDVFLSQIGTMNQVDTDTIKNETGFGIIKAVRNGEIFFVEETIVSRPTFRLLEGIVATGSYLYPEIFNPSGQGGALSGD